MPDRIFYTLIAGFVGGVLLRSFINFGLALPLFILVLGAVVLAVDRKTLFLSVFLFAAGFGVLRFDLADRTSVRHALDASLGTSASFEGIIRDEPDERESTTRLLIETTREKTLVLVTTDKEPRFHYGDRVSFTGKLETPNNFTDEVTLREVDYASYLAKDSIYYEIFRPQITLLARGEGNAIIASLFAFKEAFVSRLDALIPQPQASLLGGLVVGAKQSLGKQLLEDFRTVGIIHIVVLSGYNITIIAIFIEWLLSRLGKRTRLVIAAGAIFLFALMVGASATVIRATVMALLALLARGIGRMYQVTRALLVAGVIMLLHNPKILVFDTSFQLSFLATLALIYVSPIVEPHLTFITERWKLREVATATIATQVFVLPFILYKMGTLSLVALPVNLLILLVIPPTMLFGFLAGILGFIWSVLALPFAWIAYALLSYELLVVEWFARLPFAVVTVPSFPLWVTLCCYAMYGVLIWRLRRSSSLPRSN